MLNAFCALKLNYPYTLLRILNSMMVHIHGNITTIMCYFCIDTLCTRYLQSLVVGFLILSLTSARVRFPKWVSSISNRLAPGWSSFFFKSSFFMAFTFTIFVLGWLASDCAEWGSCTYRSPVVLLLTFHFIFTRGLYGRNSFTPPSVVVAYNVYYFGIYRPILRQFQLFLFYCLFANRLS